MSAKARRTTAFNGEEDYGDKDRADGLEELMPELVAMVFSHVDSVGLVACRFVCTAWMTMLRSSTSRPREAPHYQHEEQEQDKEDYSKQFAANRWLEVLQWARANGCPWDEWTCAHAALGGHLEVLQWAQRHGCPQD